MTSVSALLESDGASIEVDDDWDTINNLYLQRGWSDGLPIVPPTTQRLEQMLAYCDRPWDQPVARIAPRWGDATPLRLAANAVMAGCRPEYFPILMLAIEAMCEEQFNLYGIQATTHPCAPLVIVNGPIVQELGINAGHNAFGPGWQSNATIGRAIRLALINIGGAIPGTGDMSTFGSPAKYSFLVAENEAASPWQPLHVERGFPAHASTVTIVGAENPHNVNDHESLSGLGVLKMIAGTVAITGSNNASAISMPTSGEALIVFGPELAATVAGDGYSKADVKRFLFEHARIPLGSFSDENILRRLKVRSPELYTKAGANAMVAAAERAENFMIAVIGGAGKHAAFLPTFGTTRAVTRALKRRDGELARSVQELRV